MTKIDKVRNHIISNYYILNFLNSYTKLNFNLTFYLIDLISLF